ncbi:MAG: FHA domain-containing protein [Acidobacteriota bacterium]
MKIFPNVTTDSVRARLDFVAASVIFTARGAKTKVIIQCPHCASRYNFSEERFEHQPSRLVRCFKCNEAFSAANPGFAAPEPVEDLGENTAARKMRRATTIDELPPTETAPFPLRKTLERPRPEELTDPFAKIQKSNAAPHLPEGARFSIAAINGPDSGKVFRIEKPRIVIGRGSGDIVLVDGEASRAHAAIEIRDSLILLQDLGSTNGTIHKGKLIEEPTPLYNHSEFVIGSTTLMLIVTRV